MTQMLLDSAMISIGIAYLCGTVLLGTNHISFYRDLMLCIKSYM